MKRSATSFFLALLFFNLLFVIAPSNVKSETEDWILETKGENYDIYHNSLNASLKQWVSANQRVQDSKGRWVDYIFRDDLYEKEGYYEVSVGLISARIYDYYAVFYSPENFTDVRLYSEMWEVQQYASKGKGGWSDVGAQSGTPVYSVVEFEDGVNVTKSFSSWAGWLNITYTFRESLKHTIMFASEIAEKTVFGVVQKWAGITGTKVKDIEANKSVPISESTKLNGTSFLFQKENEELSVYESQWSARDSLNSVMVDSHAEGMKCDFVFGNWTLAKGESLVIDPSTATLDSPTVDGYIAYVGYGGYYHYDEGNEIKMTHFYEDFWFTTRGYVEWDVSSIPDSTTVTDVTFKYHGVSRGSGDCHIHAISYRPSISGVHIIFADASDGHVYADPTGFPVIGENQQVGLSSNAVTDLQNHLSSNWFAIGIQADDENTNHPTATSIYSSEYGSVNPSPTLYVEYYEPFYITLETDPSGLEVRIDGETWYTAPHEFEVDYGAHSIECKGIQSGGTRIRYVWSSWNDSGANPHDVSPTSDTTYIASFDTQYQVYIQSYPEGSGYVEFDGSPIMTPYTSEWFDSGENRSIEATNVTVTANQERYNWSSWSDGGAISHNITIDGDAYTAYFDHQWYFKVTSVYDSPTGQGWYNDGDSTVNSTVTSPSSGHDVSGWIGTGSLSSGDVGDSNSTGTFTIGEYSTCAWVWSDSPEFDSFSASKSIVEANEVFMVSTVLSDDTGYTDFVNCSVGLGDSLVLFWDNATNTFSIGSDPDSYASLHDDSEKTVLSSTSIRLSWEISLSDSFPSGGVNVVESNTKVYDSSGLMSTGTHSVLFSFQEPARGSGPRGGEELEFPSTSDIIEGASETVYRLTSNLFTVFVLIIVGLVAMWAFYADYFYVGLVCAFLFVVLAVNFCLLFFVVPSVAELSFLEPFLLRLPSLELSTMTLGTQQALQSIVVFMVLVAFLTPIFLMVKNAR